MSEIVMITSGKGGVGKTTITALMGLQLSRMDKSVVLIDTDFGLRNLDILFGIEDKIRYNVADVLRGICSTKQACIPYESSLHIIPGTKDESFLIPPYRLEEMIRELSKSYDYILIDSPAGINTTHRAILPFVTQAVLVMTWDKSSISDAIAMSRFLHKRDIPLRTILNGQSNLQHIHFNSGEVLRLCNELLESEYLGMIPHQKKLLQYNRKLYKSMRDICYKL